MAARKLWHIGAEPWVKLHQLDHPIVPVQVEEWLGDPLAPEVTHYAWEPAIDEHAARKTDRPQMIQVRTGTGDRSMMFLDMCFPYSL